MTEEKITHPGEKIREAIEELGEITGQPYSVEGIAEHIGVKPETLSAVVNGEKNITPEMAVRLGAAFPLTKSGHWLVLQYLYDWEIATQKVDVSGIKPLRPGIPDLCF